VGALSSLASHRREDQGARGETLAHAPLKPQLQILVLLRPFTSPRLPSPPGQLRQLCSMLPPYHPRTPRTTGGLGELDGVHQHDPVCRALCQPFAHVVWTGPAPGVSCAEAESCREHHHALQPGQGVLAGRSGGPAGGAPARWLRLSTTRRGLTPCPRWTCALSAWCGPCGVCCRWFAVF